MATRTYGTMGVDWEQRVDFDRLRRERLARAKQFLAESDLGALLCFDMNNIRYLTATHIGTWAYDKLIRFCLLTRDAEPILWDFGSAARHHAIYCPWLDGEERSRAGISTLRGAVEGRAESVAEKIRVELEQRGLLGEPVGIDFIELPVLFALQNAGEWQFDCVSIGYPGIVVRGVITREPINLGRGWVDFNFEEAFKKPVKISNDAEASQRERLARLRRERDGARVEQRLAALRAAAEHDENVLPAMLDCARADCTLYEIRHALERVWGAYREPVFF